MQTKRRKKIRIVWIIISLLAVLSMIAFTVAPLFSRF
jgi:hypothetical protein